MRALLFRREVVRPLYDSSEKKLMFDLDWSRLDPVSCYPSDCDDAIETTTTVGDDGRG